MAKSKSKKYFFILIILILGAVSYYFYLNYFAKAIHLKNKAYTYLYIKSDDDLQEVVSSLKREDIIEEEKDFTWLAEKMKLGEEIHAGKFRINNGMTFRQIINLIKYNKQEKVKLFFNSQIHSIDEFINYVADKLELTEGDLENEFADDKFLDENFSLDPDNAFAAIVPTTLEVSWAINKQDFFKALKTNFDGIWSNARKQKAKKIGYSVVEVITLASIVQSESTIGSEQQKIAGVYINRLETNMELQADPTLIFANKNWGVQRVLDEDKEIDSPYNTYKNKGLPPGPICLVKVQAIDAVLNYTKHKYKFFCAKPELNGYSDFSETYEEHKKFAKAYQKAITNKGIKR